MMTNRIRTALALSAAALAIAAPTAPAATSDAQIDAVPRLREQLNDRAHAEPARTPSTTARGTTPAQIDAVPRLRQQLDGRATAQASAAAAGDAFHWDDAAIGAIGAAGLMALGAGAGLAAARLRRRESAWVG
jgi:hypothetical protein